MKGYRNGLVALLDICPDMRRIAEVCGRPRSRRRAPGFATLIRIIVDQQVSVHAGRAIWARLEGTLGEVSPDTVRVAGEDGLRACGLSSPKARYALGIAEAVGAGEVNFRGLARKSDDDVRAELMRLKGIGRWTADIYLMFAMGRPDVMPSGDIALQSAAGRLLGIEPRPDPETLDAIAVRWAPYRSIAAIMLWHAYKRMPADG